MIYSDRDNISKSKISIHGRLKFKDSCKCYKWIVPS